MTLPLPTFEEAKICPKCDRPGQVRKVSPVPGMARGTKVHLVYCVTELCPWYNTPWTVQTNPDGSVPPPRNHTGEKKIYQGFEGHDEEARHLVDILKRNAAAETEDHSSGGKGYEVRR